MFISREGGLRPVYPDTIRRTILLASQHITDYQVAQSRVGHLSIVLALAPRATFVDVSASVAASVRSTLAFYNCRPAQVEITQGVTPPTPGVKRRRVQVLQA